MSRQLTDLEQSILVLIGISNLLQKALKIQIPKDRIVDEDLKFILSNYILILISNFIDEWERLEGMGKDPQIKETLRDAAPAIDQIRKWKGIKKVRNQVLAHAFRDDDGEFIPVWEVLSKYSVPTNYAEMFLLGNCAIKAITILQVNHKEQLIKTNDYVRKHKKEIARMGIDTNGALKEELAKVDAAISQRVKWWGKG